MGKHTYMDTPEGFSKWAIDQNWNKVYERVIGDRIFQQWYTPTGLLIKRDWSIEDENNKK